MKGAGPHGTVGTLNQENTPHDSDKLTYHPAYEVAMSISRRQVLVSLLGSGAASAATAAAGQTNEPRVLTGSDLGFRIDGTARDGAPVGAIVLRIDGKWVSPQFQSGLCRIS